MSDCCWAAAPHRKELARFEADSDARVYAVWSNGKRTEVFNKFVPALRQAIILSRGIGVYEVVAVLGAGGFWGPGDLWIDGTAGVLIADGQVYEALEEELAEKVREITDGEEEWDD